MDIGRISVFVGLFASIASIIFYVLSLRGSKGALRAARISYGITTATVVICFARLAFLVYTHKFQFDYVFRYSSADLVWPWNFAATWAGQEGSFLLWMLWTGVIGGLVAWKAGKWEGRVMPLYILSLTFLFGILTWLDPYVQIVRGTGQTNYPLDLPWPPQDGQGLNPSLQNYWMAIHPPTIFFGFAALAVPFVYALAAMIWREYQTWVPRVMPYVLLASATLGVGLFMGGYWAYETQGWHGFWAWDPVENASLFPWLATLALMHGLVVQKSRGGMGRTNLFLAIMAWVMFLYGTYLTRSGVLSKVSVHSFSSLASQPTMLLVVLVAVYALTGTGLLIWRWRSIPGRPISDKFLSRDTAMVTAVTLMIVAAIFVMIGTSWPMISTWKWLKAVPLIGGSYSPSGTAVQPISYNKVGAVIIIPILLVVGSVPFLAWGKTSAEKFLQKLLLPWFIGLGAGACVLWFVKGEMALGFNPDNPSVAGYMASTSGMLVVTIAALGVFAAASNIGLAVKVLRSKAVTMGGWLAHVGVGILMVGTIISNVYEKTQYFYLIEGEPPVKTGFGYSIEYVDWTHSPILERLRDAATESERMKLFNEFNLDWMKHDHALLVRVAPLPGDDAAHAADDPGGSSGDDHAHSPGDGHDHSQPETPTKGSFIAAIPVFKTRQAMMDPNSRVTTMRWPYIHKTPIKDFYMVPAADYKLTPPTATLRPGETKRLSYEYDSRDDDDHLSVDTVKLTDFAVRYLDNGFFMNGGGGEGTTMGARIEIITADGKAYAAAPAKKIGGPDGMEDIDARIESINGEVSIVGGIDPATKTVTVALRTPEAPTRYIIPLAVTNKPWVNLVWLGVCVMGLGTVLAGARRSIEVRKGALIETTVASGMKAEPTEPSEPTVTETEAKPKRKAPSSRTKPS